MANLTESISQKVSSHFFETGVRDSNNTHEVYLTTKEVCCFLKITKGALYNLVYRGEVKRYKFGSRNRYLKSDIEKLIQ